MYTVGVVDEERHWIHKSMKEKQTDEGREKRRKQNWNYTNPNSLKQNMKNMDVQKVYEDIQNNPHKCKENADVNLEGKNLMKQWISLGNDKFRMMFNFGRIIIKIIIK